MILQEKKNIWENGMKYKDIFPVGTYSSASL